LRDEIHAPLLVRTPGLPKRYALPLCPFSTLLRSHNQTLLGIQPVDSLRVHLPAFAAQKHGQTTIAVAHTTSGQFSQTHTQGLLRVAMV
jgi:hypothetical protein